MDNDSWIIVCLCSFVIGFIVCLFLINVNNEIVKENLLDQICKDRFGNDYQFHDKFGAEPSIKCIEKPSTKEIKTAYMEINTDLG